MAGLVPAIDAAKQPVDRNKKLGRKGKP